MAHGEAIKVIATDLDGTLLCPDGSISEATRQVVAAADAKGIVWVLATGRPAQAAQGIAQRLFNSPKGRPLVCFNGALVGIMDESGFPVHILLSQRLPLAVAVDVLDLSDELGYPLQWHELDNTYNNAKPEEQRLLLRIIEGIDGNLSQSCDLSALVSAGHEPIKLVMVTGDSGSAGRLAAYARARLPEQLCHVIHAEVRPRLWSWGWPD